VFNTGHQVDVGLSEFPGPSTLALDPTGQTMYVSGFTFGSGGQVIGRVNHVLANATLDPAFGSGGSFAQTNGSLGALAIQPDGDVVIGGALGSAAIIERLAPDGSFDAGFGSAGIVDISALFSTINGIGDVAVQLDGKIVAVAFANMAGILDVTVLRLRPDGSIDPTYGTAGEVHVAQFDNLGNMRLDPSGDVVLCGATLAGATVVRLTP
jgi:uncharacterized delta-60 repeat protein